MNVSRTLYRCLMLLLLLASVETAWGQSFRRTYGPQNSFCRDAVETPDGGFLMVGGASTNNTMFLQRTNALGGAVWTNHVALNGASGIAVCAAPDGGFAVLCENYLDAGIRRNAVLKIDGNGAIQWLKVLDAPNLPNTQGDIVCTSDGSFVLTCTGRLLSPNTDFYIRLLKLDGNGVPLWDRTLGTPTTKDLAQRLALMPNGDVVVAGEQRDNAAPVVDESDFFLARCDAQGNILWQNSFPEPDYQRLYDLQVSPDGGLVLFGETYKADPVGVTFLKTDGNGVKQWLKTSLNNYYSNGNPQEAWSITCFTQDLAGNFYVPRYLINPDFSSSLNVVKFNSSGDSLWTHTSNAPDYPYAIVYTSDNQFAIVGKTDIDGGNAVLIKSDWSSGANSFFSTLSGTVFWDPNNNCIADSSETGPPLFMIEAYNQFDEHLFRNIPASGVYNFAVQPGDYTLVLHPLPGTEPLWQTCDTPTVSVGGVNLTIQAPAIGVQNLSACPIMSVELASGLIRRCTTMYYTANYCNYGNATATNPSIQLTVNPFLTYISSTQPLSAQNGDTYTFSLPDVLPGECGTMQIAFALSCAAQTGQAICAEAHIFPDSSCLPPNPLWDGSNLELSAVCNGDAEFTITNTGDDMTGIADYVIIEDQIIYMQGSVQLDAGGDTLITIPNPAGSSYYLQAEQRPGHPGNALPVAIVDMCNGQNGQSLNLQLPLNQAGYYLTTYCDEVVGAYDPNDKRGFPLGWRSEHYLPAGQDIEYVIRFQNTGNDTAFLVVVQDQLPSELNPASVRPGASSHPYTFDISNNGLLRFTFANILLPDSTTNEAASHGYISFRVAQQPDLPDGAVIENNASIYFDFNEAVVTNTYFHTIGEPLLSFILNRPGAAALQLHVLPNPAGEEAIFRIDGALPDEPYRLSLYDQLGRSIREDQFNGGVYQFRRQALASGVYFFRLENAGGRQASGTLILR